MTPAKAPPSDVAFTPAVKRIQAEKGSREAYARMEAGRGWSTEITEEIAGFIARQRSVFLATASADGQPYVQHRGGPPGFLRVLGPRTLGFADLRGNRQFISIGNLAENPKAYLFLIDYTRRTRVKIWGTAEVIEGNEALLASLATEDDDAHPERAILLHVTAWDRNCPQHIPLRLEADDVKAALDAKDRELEALRAELAQLRRSA
jgi:predicted pyridoxine 5'-phosphate oxidase superfamily flavin-nucleotide-binding protein